jgi:hypothetical protein
MCSNLITTSPSVGTVIRVGLALTCTPPQVNKTLQSPGDRPSTTNVSAVTWDLSMSNRGGPSSVGTAITVASPSRQNSAMPRKIGISRREISPKSRSLIPGFISNVVSPKAAPQCARSRYFPGTAIATEKRPLSSAVVTRSASPMRVVAPATSRRDSCGITSMVTGCSGDPLTSRRIRPRTSGPSGNTPSTVDPTPAVTKISPGAARLETTLTEYLPGGKSCTAKILSRFGSTVAIGTCESSPEGKTISTARGSSSGRCSSPYERPNRKPTVGLSRKLAEHWKLHRRTACNPLSCILIA